MPRPAFLVLAAVPKAAAVLLLLLLCADTANAEDGDYEDIDEGRISHAQCTAFTIQDDSNSTEAILEESGIFHVAAKSFMFFDYSEYSNGNDDGSSSYSNQMMVPLQTWMDAISTTKQGMVMLAAPNCTAIENASQIFSNSKGVQKLYNANDPSSTEELQIYQGPICGMGADKKRTIVTGVFLDATCTLFAPKLMYQYRKKVRRGKVDSTATNTIDVLAASSQKTLSCNKYTSFCGQLLGDAVGTQFCDQDGNNERQRRWLESSSSASEEDDEVVDNSMYYTATGSDGDTKSWFSYIWNSNNKTDEASADYNNMLYSEGSYQLSQSDLYDIGSTCYAAVTSMDEGVTLEAYLLYHGQLRTRDPKTTGQIVKMIIFIVLGMLGAYLLLFKCVKIRRVKKKQQPKQLEIEEGDTDGEDSSSSSSSSDVSGTFATMHTEYTTDDPGTCLAEH
ncbi:MAG: hypothetical protein SGARI_004428 [Bacillariaceae sp.]